ncbi:MAG: hypothetical protein H7257_07175 [Taibaiella sp.]|nr:hypothetical protein [Taibaiella sp.]
MKFLSSVLVAAGASCLLFASCNNTPESTATTTATDSASTKTTTETAAALTPVALQPVTPSPEFPNAMLEIKDVKHSPVGTDSTKLTFSFTVKNYQLAAQTTDGAGKGCNNSDKGQHIHFILDHQPYKALYEPKNEVTVANGTEHYLMCFLSRSYHESVKTKGAAVVYHFKLDEKGAPTKMDVPSTPMLFYSRPKGDYIGKDTANVMLDFYVWNCQLGADGYKVTADISNTSIAGKHLTATIDKWEPKFITNLGVGKCKVTLSLIDKDNQKVQGPNTDGEREFNMAASEPMK